MRPSDTQIMELKPSTRKSLIFLGLSAPFAIGGFLIMSEATFVGLVMGALATILGISGMVASCAALFLRRMALTLTPQGFGFGTLWKKYFYRWSDIAAIGVARVAKKKVCFTFRAGYLADEKLRATNRASFGFDRFLPDTYGMEPSELARLLWEWRERHRQTNANLN